MTGAATMPGTQPLATQITKTSAIATAAAQVSFSGLLMRFSSRRCAASQAAESCSFSGGTGRRGGGPGSGCSVAYCQPR